jgi:SAM-dependent methyltransferase
MQAMSFSDHFSRQAADYSRFRPRYPPELFEYLGSLTTAHELAWDCATGNGQAAISLATFYQRVEATDASAQQVANAIANERVHYQVCEASHSPFADNQFDLVSVAQALHWFDLDNFYPEVKRVTKPGGVFAAWCYGLFNISTEIDTLIQGFHDETVGACWPEGRQHITRGYTSLAFPFERIANPEFHMGARWTLPQLLGYLGTWSAVHYYRDQYGEDPLVLLAEQLASAWPEPQTARDVRWPVALHVGRVNK